MNYIFLRLLLNRVYRLFKSTNLLAWPYAKRESHNFYHQPSEIESSASESDSNVISEDVTFDIS